MLPEITNNICLTVMIKIISQMKIKTLIKPTKITFVHSMMYKSPISGYARSLKEYFQIGIFLLHVDKKSISLDNYLGLKASIKSQNQGSTKTNHC